MAEITTYSSDLDSSLQIAKYSYSNLTTTQLNAMFDKSFSSNAGARLRQPLVSSPGFTIGAFDIGWEGYSFDGVDEIVSTGHLLKLIGDKIKKGSTDTSSALATHEETKATQTILGHTYITDSYTLSAVTGTNQSYTAVSIYGIDQLHTKITAEYKDYISSTVLGGEVTNNSLDTIKELSEWITTHGEEAADLISQFNKHEQKQSTLSVLGHAYLAQSTTDLSSISTNAAKQKITAVSAYAFAYTMTDIDQKISDCLNSAYAYAGQVADNALTQAKNYANSVATSTLASAKSYTQKYTDQAIKVVLSWQII